MGKVLEMQGLTTEFEGEWSLVGSTMDEPEEHTRWCQGPFAKQNYGGVDS